MSPTPKVIVQTFENYAKSQVTFVQNLADLAAKPTYVECLCEWNAVDIVLPLTVNTNATVRTNAVLSLTRLAGNSESCAKQMLCSKTLLNQLFGQIPKENKYYKRNCMSLVKNLSKYSTASAEIVVKDCGGIDAVLTCMKDFDACVRESALQAIGSISRQEAHLAQIIVNSGVLQQVVVCLKEQQQHLKLNALTVLDEISKHNKDLAHKVVDAHALPYVMNFLSLNFTDVKVQRSALTLIKNIVKHSLFLTENAIDAKLFPDLLLLTAHPDEAIRYNTAIVIREVVKHSVQIALMVMNFGGIASLLNVISCSKRYPSGPAVVALGYMCAMSPILASAVIQSKALMHLTAILKSGADSNTKCGTVWTLGNIGQHSPEHSRAICADGTINAIMDVYMDSYSDKECRFKCRIALQLILNECDDYAVLEKLLTSSPPVELITHILDKISKILPKNNKARRSFITNGHLKMIQSFKPEIDSDLFRVIEAVNCCFPEDIIQMVAGDFPETVMKAVDKYVPQSRCLFYNRQSNIEDQLSSKSHPTQKKLLSGEEELPE